MAEPKEGKRNFVAAPCALKPFSFSVGLMAGAVLGFGLGAVSGTIIPVVLPMGPGGGFALGCTRLLLPLPITDLLEQQEAHWRLANLTYLIAMHFIARQPMYMTENSASLFKSAPTVLPSADGIAGINH
jgi:hypothetical protein